MKTLATDLLTPYADCLDRLGEARQTTVAEALIRAEARHVAQVRNDQGEPWGGWKNDFPLEHATALGHFIRSCRTGDKAYIRKQAKTHADSEIRELYSTLCNVEHVYIESPGKLGTDSLIAYAASEIDNG